MTLEEFLVQTQGDVRKLVSERMAEGGYLKAEAAFTDVVMQHLSECGMTFDTRPLHIERKISGAMLKLNGYAVSDDADQLDLFVTLYAGTDTVESIPDSEVVKAAEQCLRFLGKAADGTLANAIDPSDDAYELCLTIRDCYAELEQIRVYVITDRQAKTKSFKSKEVAGRSVRLEAMDIERLYRHWSEGKPRDELVVNFEEICGSAIPCVYVPGEDEDYDYALTAMPGNALRLLYDRYGARLLEANVRSFLSQTGKVNKGIRDTLRDAPERFMAYNNGIVLIADEASFSRTSDGSTGLSWLKGMQIVNGGQTTASIYFTKRKHPEVDLGRVRVPAKVIILHRHDPESEDILIGDISKYANSQNAVKVSDLSANKPFHIELEKLALATYCPDGVGRWFYERASGSYNVMLAREGTTPAKLKKIREMLPSSRKFGKTDLAKYIQAWSGNPHIVSLGSQKNFDRFMSDPESAAASVSLDVAGYKQLIAQAIIFKAVHKIVLAGDFNQAQANITAYTVSWLAEQVRDKISLESIWQRQSISPQLSAFAKVLASRMDEVLRQTAAGAQISEWAKKEECWARVQSGTFPPIPAGIPELSR
ncbi:AIPR family protein [Bradyrhizobium liaoningense]|uniref:AIPR family protein n=1 Tax=Bradyrhizobium liaoningense TaxID=43992 RepID=UPI001BACB87A|nr:AIPR family protein [Bradyrhizobium liaoningense]MBR0816305.1 AIPR family protein [Bradyrhizobium liaoningense]